MSDFNPEQPSGYRERKKPRTDKRRELGGGEGAPSAGREPQDPSRRRFIKSTVGVTGATVLFGAGYLAGSHETVERNSLERRGNESFEEAIKRIEANVKPENLEDKNLRDKFARLVAHWYTRRAFVPGIYDVNADRLFNSIEWIEDPQDEKLKEHENSRAWNVAGEYIRVNLATVQEFKQPFSDDLYGARFTPLSSLRDALTHEFVHFFALPNKDNDVAPATLKIFRDYLPDPKQKFEEEYILGFRAIYGPDLVFFNSFDEAATELISNYWQRQSRIGLIPQYGGKKEIEGIIPLLEATLHVAGISMEKFTDYHNESNLGRLAMDFANATENNFENDEERIEFGLNVLTAIDKRNTQALGGYWQKFQTRPETTQPKESPRISYQRTQDSEVLV